MYAYQSPEGRKYGIERILLSYKTSKTAYICVGGRRQVANMSKHLLHPPFVLIFALQKFQTLFGQFGSNLWAQSVAWEDRREEGAAIFLFPPSNLDLTLLDLTWLHCCATWG
jgi:hypothetical protein